MKLPQDGRQEESDIQIEQCLKVFGKPALVSIHLRVKTSSGRLMLSGTVGGRKNLLYSDQQWLIETAGL